MSDYEIVREAITAGIKWMDEHGDGCADDPYGALVRIEKHDQQKTEALRDFAEYGTRHDLNPTRMIHNTPEWMESEAWWRRRAESMDRSVRERASRALAVSEGETA